MTLRKSATATVTALALILGSGSAAFAKSATASAKVVRASTPVKKSEKAKDITPAVFVIGGVIVATAIGVGLSKGKPSHISP